MIAKADGVGPDPHMTKEDETYIYKSTDNTGLASNLDLLILTSLVKSPLKGGLCLAIPTDRHNHACIMLTYTHAHMYIVRNHNFRPQRTTHN